MIFCSCIFFSILSLSLLYLFVWVICTLKRLIRRKFGNSLEYFLETFRSLDGTKKVLEIQIPPRDIIPWRDPRKLCKHIAKNRFCGKIFGNEGKEDLFRGN